jgi:sucrose phosphorylase
LVQKHIELIRLRNTHPAFGGEFHVEAPEKNLLEMKWNRNEHWIKLNLDLSVPSASITGSDLKVTIEY